MINKTYAIIIAAVVIIAVLFAISATGREILFDWGTEEIQGAGTVSLKALGEDGTFIDIPLTSNPLSVVYDGVIITELHLTLTVKATDTTVSGQFPMVKVDMQSIHSVWTVYDSDGIEIRQDIHDNFANVVSAFPTDGEVIHDPPTLNYQMSTDTYGIAGAMGSYSGEFTVEISFMGGFVYQGCDINGNAKTEWFSEVIDGNVIPKIILALDTDISGAITFEWDVDVSKS